MNDTDSIVQTNELIDLVKIFNSLVYFLTHEERQALFIFFKGVSERMGEPEVIN